MQRRSILLHVSELELSLFNEQYETIHLRCRNVEASHQSATQLALGAGGACAARVGEFFLCSRHGLALEVTTPGLPKLKSRRSFRFLTTSRIVFVSQPPVQLGNGAPPFVSFELPLRGLTAEKFNPRGLLGANYLSGRAACVPGMGLTGDASFSLTFNEGGAGTFLSLFFRALTESRLPAKQASAHATLRSTVIATGSFRLAVIDPNDPSIIYVTQPAIPTAPLAQGQGQHD